MQKCKVGVIRCYSIRYTSLCGWIPLHFAVKCPHYRVFSPHIGALQSTQNRENIPQDTVQRPLFWFLPSHFYHLDTGWNWLSVSENRKKRCRRWILRNFQAIHLQICHFCLCGQPRKTYHKAAISCPFLHFQEQYQACRTQKQATSNTLILQNLRFLQRGEKDGTGICGNLSYLRNLRAIEPLITHCQE